MGLLSFPSIFNRLGMVGGVIATLGLGFLAYITAWIMVDFKLRYPGVMNYADAGTVMFGKRGGQILGVGMFLKVGCYFPSIFMLTSPPEYRSWRQPHSRWPNRPYQHQLRFRLQGRLCRHHRRRVHSRRFFFFHT